MSDVIKGTEKLRLPQKHGRLIDADELLKVIKKLESTEFYCDVDGDETSSYLLNTDSVIGAIESAPTIIDAEE